MQQTRCKRLQSLWSTCTWNTLKQSLPIDMDQMEAHPTIKHFIVLFCKYWRKNLQVNISFQSCLLLTLFSTSSWCNVEKLKCHAMWQTNGLRNMKVELELSRIRKNFLLTNHLLLKECVCVKGKSLVHLSFDQKLI